MYEKFGADFAVTCVLFGKTFFNNFSVLPYIADEIVRND
jgi:hypothetical protein